MVGWWPLDQLGSEVEELVGGNHGDYIEIPLEAAGIVGGALRFDGNNDLIAVPDPGEDWVLDITNDITMETWIKRDSVTTPQQVVVGKNGTYWLGCRNGRIFGLIASSVDLSGATHMSLGNWFHIAFTYDVVDKVAKLYLNGEVDAVVATSGRNILVNANPVYIGGLPGQQFFKGYIDEVSIYNTALSTDEIREIYIRGSLGKCK
jgi:hypothetical protein